MTGSVKLSRFRHSPGRAFYDHKLAQGHTPKDAIRALKRRISNVVYRHLIADATGMRHGPGRATRERLHKPA